MFIGAHEAEYMFVTTLLKIEQHLLAQGRCPYSHLGLQSSQPGDLVGPDVRVNSFQYQRDTIKTLILHDEFKHCGTQIAFA